MSSKLKIKLHERRTLHPSEDPLTHRSRPAPHRYVDMYNTAMPVYVSKDIVPALEHALVFGDRKDELVSFRYYNVLDDRYSRPINLTYHDALELGLQRAKDMRYKKTTSSTSTWQAPRTLCKIPNIPRQPNTHQPLAKNRQGLFLCSPAIPPAGTRKPPTRRTSHVKNSPQIPHST